MVPGRDAASPGVDRGDASSAVPGLQSQGCTGVGLDFATFRAVVDPKATAEETLSARLERRGPLAVRAVPDRVAVDVQSGDRGTSCTSPLRTFPRPASWSPVRSRSGRSPSSAASSAPIQQGLWSSLRSAGARRGLRRERPQRWRPGFPAVAFEVESVLQKLLAARDDCLQLRKAREGRNSVERLHREHWNDVCCPPLLSALAFYVHAFAKTYLEAAAHDPPFCAFPALGGRSESSYLSSCSVQCPAVCEHARTTGEALMKWAARDSNPEPIG